MDTTNQPKSNLPAHISQVGTRLPAPLPVSSIGGPMGVPSTSGTSIDPRSLFRGLIRHWWHILGLWLLVSLPVMYAIYVFVEPKYEAAGMLRVEPAKPNIYSASVGSGERGYAESYLSTQIELITSKRVLEAVATDPEVKGMPLITESKDPLVDLSKALSVAPIKGTFLIRVSLTSQNSNEAYKVVRSVIQSYMEQVKEYGQSTNTVMIKTFTNEAKKVESEIEKAKKDLMELSAKGTIQVVKKVPEPKEGATSGQSTETTISADSVSENQYSLYRTKLIETGMSLKAAESMLKQKEEESDPAKKAEAQEVEKAIAEQSVDQQIEIEFRNDPEVSTVLNKIEDKEKELARVGKIARNASDPVLRYLKDDIIALEKQYKQLWENKYKTIQKQVKAQNATLPESSESLNEIKEKVAKLRVEKGILENTLNDLKIENIEARSDGIKAELARKKLDALTNRHYLIENHLKQASFEAGTEQVRVSIADPVIEPKTPSKNNRSRFMAVAPVAVLFVFVSLFLILEIKAERVSDPDALSTRVQSEVFALPPLPSAREVRKMRELENGSDQIDRFIQRLDHLRFAVCGSQTALDNGRCVLITSAVGGEGKTTLAAQLAARCGNAGMSTLLIDADLRRASLGTLLDVPEGPGLSDVLKGELTIEEVAVPVQGGTFHLLPAGTPIEDVSRILHGPNFGILVARLRELYDLVVIDSPPVLPVPDALIIGQWVDGAILASRFDISRFPQVERARRQLDIAGITVLGTVINGMRSSDSYYGHYSYARKKGPQPDSSNAS